MHPDDKETVILLVNKGKERRQAEIDAKPDEPGTESELANNHSFV